MKKNKSLLFYIISTVMTLGLTFGLVTDDTYARALDQAATISAYDYKGEEVLPMTAVELEEGDTAYDMLEEAADKHDKALDVTEYEGMGVFLNSIGDVAASGDNWWAFQVNGEMASVGMSAYEVENADNIKFQVDSMAKPLPTYMVTVSVLGKQAPLIDSVQVKLPAYSTAYDALKLAAKKSDVAIDASVDSDYFTMINNIGSDTLGETEFFSFDYNGGTAAVGAVSQRVTEGDTVGFERQDWSNPSAGETDDGAETDDTNDTDDTQEPEDDEKPVEEVPNKVGVGQETILKELASLQDYTIKQYAPLHYGDEWLVWSLAHDVNYEDFTTYKDSVAKALKDNEGNLGGLETQKLVIALSLLGYDASDFAGYDLVAGMLQNNMNTLPNTLIYTLLALDSANYGVDAGVREDLVVDLLAAELPDGGWTYFGADPSVDITAMALNALAPYRGDADVDAAIERAVTFLSKEQADNGGYYEEFNGGYSSESAAQVVTALVALDIDPTSKAFTKSEGNLFDYLLRFKQKDGGYAHTIDDNEVNRMSVEQSLLAFTAYHNFVNKLGSVYVTQKPIESGDSGDKETSKEKETTSVETSSEESSTTESEEEQKEGVLPETGVGTVGAPIVISFVLTGTGLLLGADNKKRK